MCFAILEMNFAYFSEVSFGQNGQKKPVPWLAGNLFPYFPTPANESKIFGILLKSHFIFQSNSVHENCNHLFLTTMILVSS